MWEESKCKNGLIESLVPKNSVSIVDKKDVFTAEWSDEYKMWVVYPIYHYPDGSLKDASGQIIN